MNVSIAELIQTLLEAAWRRRILIIVPIVFFSIVAALASQLWPRNYASTLLLMLQERSSPNPLRSNVELNRELQIKADEIEALLKSDKVLTGAILDQSKSAQLPGPVSIDAQVRDLRGSLSVKVVGSQFIAIDLKDTDPVGLGARLTSVATRFLETFLTRDDNLKTVRLFVLEQRRRDRDAAKAALERWRALHARDDGSSGTAAVDIAAAKAADARARFASAKRALDVAAELALGEVKDPAEIARVIASERSANPPASKSDSAAGASRQVGDALADLQDKYEAYATARESNDQAQAALRDAQTANPAAEVLRRERQLLQARVAETTELFELHQARASATPSGPSSALGLTAPEFIRVLDEPRDPLAPVASIVKVLLACIIAGIGLGIGLAALAEQFDQRIYNGRDLARACGAPLVAELPRLDSRTLSALERPVPAIARHVSNPDPPLARNGPAAIPLRPRRPRSPETRSRTMNSAIWQSAIEQIGLSTAASGGKFLGIAALHRDAGCSLTCRSLARSIAASGSATLLMDLSEDRRDQIAGAWHPDQDDVRRWITPTDGGHDVLPIRVDQATRSLFGNATRMKAALDASLAGYDKVIVDLPPLVEANELVINPIAAAKLCDRLFLLVALARDTRSDLSAAMASLKAAGVNLAGIVTNGRDNRRPGEEAAALARAFKAWMPFPAIRRHARS